MNIDNNIPTYDDNEVLFIGLNTKYSDEHTVVEFLNELKKYNITKIQINDEVIVGVGVFLYNIKTFKLLDNYVDMRDIPSLKPETYERDTDDNPMFPLSSSGVVPLISTDGILVGIASASATNDFTFVSYDCARRKVPGNINLLDMDDKTFNSDIQKMHKKERKHKEHNKREIIDFLLKK